MNLLLSSALIFLLSCGQNAFLEGDSRSIFGLSDGGGSDSVLIDTKEVNFGKVLAGPELFKYITISNETEDDLSRLEFRLVGDRSYQVDHGDCDEILAGQSCRIKLSFETDGLELGSYDANLYIVNDTDLVDFRVSITGEIVEEDDNDGEIEFSYLNGKKINLGKINLGSTHRKLVYVESVGDRANRITDIIVDGESSVSYPGIPQACNGLIQNGCFLEVEVKAEKRGKFSERIHIKYITEGSSVTQLAELSLVYRVVKDQDCSTHEEYVELAKEKSQLNSYERSLSFPYYNERPNTKATLETTINTLFTRYVSVGDIIYEFNEDTQVFFSFNLAQRQLKSGRLLLDILKYEDVRNDSYNTEILCSLDYKLCSGKRFIERNFRKLIKKDFSVLNKHFSRRVVNTHNRGSKGLRFYKARDQFSLEKYLELGADHLNKLQTNQGTMSFVVADDIRLMRTPLLVLTKKTSVSCN